MSAMLSVTEPSDFAPECSPTSPSAIKSAMDINNVLTTQEMPTSPVADALTCSEVHEEPVISDQTCAAATTTSDVDKASAVAALCDAGVKVKTKSRSRRARDKDVNEVFGDPSNREFICMNDEYSQCMTGQYTLNLARKVISNHFGRNKACTRAIKSWPLFCRKHYQRATYKPDLWQRRKIDLIARQLEVIEEARPGTTYKISLKKSEENRLNTFARLADQGLTHQQASTAVEVDGNNKAFQAPIDVLREIADYLGEGKSMAVSMTLVTLILEMLKSGETTQVPSIEFLPEIVDDLPEVDDTKPSTSARAAASGAIQKPRKK